MGDVALPNVRYELEYELQTRRDQQRRMTAADGSRNASTGTGNADSHRRRQHRSRHNSKQASAKQLTILSSTLIRSLFNQTQVLRHARH